MAAKRIPFIESQGLTLPKHKFYVKQAARDLGYGEEVITQIELADSTEETSKIMMEARKKYLG